MAGTTVAIDARWGPRPARSPRPASTFLVGVGGSYAVHPNFALGLELAVATRSSISLDSGTYIGDEAIVSVTGTFVRRPVKHWIVPALIRTFRDQIRTSAASTREMKTLRRRCCCWCPDASTTRATSVTQTCGLRRAAPAPAPVDAAPEKTIERHGVDIPPIASRSEIVPLDKRTRRHRRH